MILPNFLKEQTQRDLEKGVYTKEALDQTWQTVKKDPYFVRFKILNRTLFANINQKMVSYPRYLVLCNAFKHILKLQRVSNCDLIISMHDSLDHHSSPALIGTFAAKRETKNIILLPDCEALNSKDRLYLENTILRANCKFSWSQKIDKAFWRGAATGFTQHKNPLRCKIVQLSQTASEKIDARFTLLPHDVPDAYKEVFGTFPPIHPKDHLRYKYLLDLDGNSCCYSRTYWILLSNSLMIKHESENVQWFYRGLKADFHYLSFESSSQSLLQQLAWSTTHQEACKEMAENGTSFALKYLNYEMNMFYLGTVLKEYASRLTFSPCRTKDDRKVNQKPLKRCLSYVKSTLRKYTRTPTA